MLSAFEEEDGASEASGDLGQQRQEAGTDDGEIVHGARETVGEGRRAKRGMWGLEHGRGARRILQSGGSVGRWALGVEGWTLSVQRSTSDPRRSGGAAVGSVSPQAGEEVPVRKSATAGKPIPGPLQSPPPRNRGPILSSQKSVMHASGGPDGPENGVAAVAAAGRPSGTGPGPAISGGRGSVRRTSRQTVRDPCRCRASRVPCLRGPRGGTGRPHPWPSFRTAAPGRAGPVSRHHHG